MPEHNNSLLEQFIGFMGNRYGTRFNKEAAEELVKQSAENSQQEEIRKSHDYKERISVEVLAEPNTPDAHGHWYSEETIQKGFESADKAWKDGRLNMNLFHAYDDVEKKHLRLENHYLTTEDQDYNGELVKKGSWISEVKWLNEDLWKRRITPLEDGMPEIAGLSLRGWGTINTPKTLQKSAVDENSLFEYYDIEAQPFGWSEILKATTDDVTRDDKGNLVYRGQKFPGYNKPMADSGNKQGKVLAKKGDQIKVVRFGDPSMADNQSVEANDRFYDRFGGQDGMGDKFSALYFSARWLWPRGKLKGKGAKEFYKLK